MRRLCALVLAACLSLLPLALGGGVVKAMVVCGTFDGKFSCKSSLGGVPRGKNALPGVDVDTTPQASESAPAGPNPSDPAAGGWTTNQGAAESPADATTSCQHGMVGTPPDCRCPKNSELLGGNCVHYTASACSSGLASDALPQACRGVEEKLSCTMRNDGLKDCCCVVYDKF